MADCFAVGAIVLLLAACTEGEHLAPATQTDNSIVLDVKEVVTPVTRAQHTGSMNFTQLKSTGFGVYGYEYDKADTYNATSQAPNLFAANTQISFEPDGTDPTTLLTIPGSWKYEGELKPWNTDKRYTFFAYAPWMSSTDETLGTGSGKTGIVEISTDNGDPKIGYIVSSFPATSVDLLWGVRTDTETNAGKPWVDVQRGQTASAVLFTFYHALCALGYHAQVIVDQNNNLTDLGDRSNIGTIGSKDGCKVTLKKVLLKPKKLASEGGVLFHTSAYLNLNNSGTPHQPNWTGHAVEKYEGLFIERDRDEINPELADPKLPSPIEDDFGSENPENYQVMDSVAYDDEVPGVTESANSQVVIKNDDLFMLIPQAAQDYTVTVEYFITYKTASGYHREAHTGTATISNLELVAGVKYYINLVFGLTTFKVSVTAQDWEETTTPVTIATETGTSASNSLVRHKNDNYNEDDNEISK